MSSRYVVAAAEIFYEQGGHDSRDNDAMDPRNWRALPGARYIDSIKTVESNDDDWKDIARIEVHPLYEGYCVNNCADAAKYSYNALLIIINRIIDRKEHNVAVLELKTELQFSHNSAYLPICLPKSCGKTCRTWGRKTEDQILGRDAFSFNFLDGSIPRLDIIDNAHCKRRLNSWVPRKVKRLIFNISY